MSSSGGTARLGSAYQDHFPNSDQPEETEQGNHVEGHLRSFMRYTEHNHLRHSLEFVSTACLHAGHAICVL